MLRDITLGQYVPAESVIHRLDPRFKVIFVIALTVMIFVATNFVAMGAVFLLVLAACLLSKVPAKLLIRSFRPLLPFILFTVILNMLYVGGETVLVQFWIIKITLEGVYISVMMTLRIVLMLLGSSLLTFTTTPIMLTDALERLMKPLALIKVPVADIAMMMTVALRFIPTLIGETDKIMNAQKARGANLDSGKLGQRTKALIPVLIPLFVSAFKRADELALAMECRCYTGSGKRTRMRQMKTAPRDFVAAATVCLMIAAIIVANSFFGTVFLS